MIILSESPLLQTIYPDIYRPYIGAELNVPLGSLDMNRCLNDGQFVERINNSLHGKSAALHKGTVYVHVLQVPKRVESECYSSVIQNSAVKSKIITCVFYSYSSHYAFLKSKWGQACRHTFSSRFGRLRQADFCELEASRLYIVISTTVIAH